MAYATKLIKEALTKANGNMSEAARILGCARSTVYERCIAKPELMQISLDNREALLDMAENKLEEAVQDGKPWAIAMVITKLGKTRGYSERQEIGGIDSGPLEIVIRRAD
jgi:hypothetical protein